MFSVINKLISKTNIFTKRNLSSHPLSFILTGFEHSGTTLLSEIMRQQPNIDSGFEGGLLLVDQLSKFPEFEPFATNFKNGWKISDQELEIICSSNNYGLAYERIRKFSGIIKDKNCELFDKTPRYLQQLSSVLNKVSDVKAVVLVRDMRSIMDSSFSRSKLEFGDWESEIYPRTLKHTLSYLDGLNNVLNDDALKKRVLVVQYEELILQQEEVAMTIYEFLGYEFKPEYLKFNDVRYKHVYGNSIQTDYIKKYEANLNKSFQEKVIDDFSNYKQYLWLK